MKLIYLSVPHLPLQVEAHRRGWRAGTMGRGVVIGGRPWDPSVVLDCSPEATAAGVTPGMDLERATLRCPEATFLDADHETYQAAQTQIEAALRGFTDRVETVGLGQFLLAVEQLSRRFPEETELAKTLIETVRKARPFDLQVGLAEQRFTAEQAALAARPNRALIVPTGRGRRFLASLPLDALPAENEFLRRLTLLGVRTLGDLAAIPRTALVRQFGSQAAFLHDLAAGADPRPVHPDAPPLELRCDHTFEPPTAMRPLLLAVADQMATRLSTTLNRRGYQAQGLRVTLTDTEEVANVSTTSVDPPTADQGLLTRRIQFLANRIQLKHSVETIEVVIYPLRPAYLGATQLALFSAPRDHRLRRLQEALRVLRDRFGEFIVMIGALIRPPNPRPLDVITDPNRMPSVLIPQEAYARRGPTAYEVHTIYEHWRERRLWWARPLLRDYYRLEDETGTVRLIYQDLVSQHWWLERRG